MIKDNLNIAYDLSGNLLLTIPKSYIQNADQDTLLQSVERLLKSAKKKVASRSDWQGDSAADIVGIGESGVTTGMRTEYSIAVHQEDGATGTKEILPTNSLIGDMVYLIP